MSAYYQGAMVSGGVLALMGVVNIGICEGTLLLVAHFPQRCAPPNADLGRRARRRLRRQ